MPHGFVSLKKHHKIVKELKLNNQLIQDTLQEERNKHNMAMTPRVKTADELAHEVFDLRNQVMQAERKQEKAEETIRIIKDIIDLGRM